MGQKVNPISNRLGIIRGWDSNWFGGSNYGDTLVEDDKIRKYLNERLAKASVARIVIERTLKLVTITICTARPGIIIGKQGSEVEVLKQELIKLTNKDVQINIHEVKRPELDAQLVAANVAHQIEGKIAYRRAVKMAIASTMRMGAEGIKIQVKGAKCSRKVALRCTPSVPISTTHSCPPTPRSVSSVSRFGSAAVRSMVSVTWPPTLPAMPTSAAVAVVVVENAASVVVSAVARETTIVKPSHNQQLKCDFKKRILKCYNLKD